MNLSEKSGNKDNDGERQERLMMSELKKGRKKHTCQSSPNHFPAALLCLEVFFPVK